MGEGGEAGKKLEGRGEGRERRGAAKEGDRAWRKRSERTYWAGQREERLHHRTFWPEQQLTPRPRTLRPLRWAAGGGAGAWLCLGRGFEEASGLVRGAVAPRGDVSSSWSRGLPPAADVRPLNNRERSEEREFPATPSRAPSSRPSTARRGRRPKWWGCSEDETETLRREAARRQDAGTATARHSRVPLSAGRRGSRARGAWLCPGGVQAALSRRPGALEPWCTRTWPAGAGTEAERLGPGELGSDYPRISTASGHRRRADCHVYLC